MTGLFRPGGFSRQVGTTLAAQVVFLMLSLATNAIIARALGPAGKGILSLAILAPSLMALFLGGGIGIANVYFAGSDRLSVAALTRNSMALALIAVLLGVVIVVGLASTRWLQMLLPDVPLGIALLAMAMLPASLLSSHLIGILQGRRRIEIINVINVVQGACTLALMAILILAARMGLVGAVVAYLGGGFLAMALALRFIRKEGGSFRPLFDRLVMRKTLAFGLRGYVANVLQFFNYRLDVLIVNLFLGPAAVGIYGASVALAELLWYLPNAMGFVLFPKSAGAGTAEMNRFTPQVFGLNLGLTLLGGIMLALVGKFALNLVYGPAFLSAYGPLLILLPGVIALGGGKVLSSEIAGRGHPQYNSIGSGLGLLITIALDLLLIPRLGIEGAALASSIAYVSTFVVTLLYYRQVSRRAAVTVAGA